MSNPLDSYGPETAPTPRTPRARAPSVAPTPMPMPTPAPEPQPDFTHPPVAGRSIPAVLQAMRSKPTMVVPAPEGLTHTTKNVETYTPPKIETPEEKNARIVRQINEPVPIEGEVDETNKEPMGLKEQAILAGQDPKLKDKASALLEDKSIKDILVSNQKDDWIPQRAQQIMNTQGAVPPEKLEAQKQKAWNQAVDELATLATVNYSNGPIPLPLDKAPNSSYWNALVGKKAEIVGKDKYGAPLIRVQTDAGWALQTLSLPETMYVSTGIPEFQSQVLYGHAPGTKEIKYTDLFDPEYAKHAAATKRTFSDIAKETDIQNPYLEAAVKTGAGIGDVVFPDLLTTAAVGGKLAKVGALAIAGGKDSAGVRALMEDTRGIRAMLGGVSKDDALAHLAAVESAEDEARLTAEAGNAEERLNQYAEKLPDVAAESKKFGEPMHAELERRALAAVSGAAAKSGGERTLLESLVLGDRGIPARDTVQLTKNLQEYVRVNGVMPETERLLGAIQTGRAQAIESLRNALTETTKLPEKPIAALRGIAEAKGPTPGSPAAMAPTKWTVVGAVQDVLGMGPKSKATDAVYQAAKDGTLKLLPDEREALISKIKTTLAGRDVPPNLVPMAGEKINVKQLAKIDEYVSDQRKVLKAQRVGLEAEDTFRLIKPNTVAQHATDRIVTVFRLGTEGGDATKEFTQKYLSKDIREAHLRCVRAIDAVMSDVSRLQDPAQGITYMQKAVVADKGGRVLITSGTSHYDLFKAAVDIRLVGDSALADIAHSFIPTEDLAAWTAAKDVRLDKLTATFREEISTGKPIEDVMVKLQNESAALVHDIADVAPNGWRRFVSGVAAHGTQVPVMEELFGSGVVLTEAQRNALSDTFSGSLGAGKSQAYRAEVGGNLVHKAELEDKLREYLAEQESKKAARTGGVTPIPLFDMPAQAPAPMSQYEKSLRAAIEREDRDIAAARAGHLARQSNLPNAELAASLQARGLPPEAEYVALPKQAPTIPGLVDPFKNIIDRDVLERVTQIKNLMDQKSYVPTYVREQLAQQLSRAMSRDTGKVPLAQQLMSNLKTGLTRGTWMVSPRYTVFNFYGDWGQTAMSHGHQVAIKNGVRTILQQAMAAPMLGQGLAVAGLSEESRRTLQIAGDLFSSPKKIKETLAAITRLNKGGVNAFRALTEQVSSLSEVNKILDGSNDVIRLGDRLISGRKLRETAVRTGVLDTLAHGVMEDEIESFRLQTLSGSKTLAQLDPHKVDTALRASVEDIVEGVGERQRVGLFATLIENGADPVDAGNGVVDALYDYKHSLSAFDKSTLWKILNPWWSWQKNANAQMNRTLMAPMGAYRIKVLSQGPKTVTNLVSDWYEETSVDKYGVHVDNMNQTEHDTYAKFIAGMHQYYPEMSDKEIRSALWNIAPLGANAGGISTWKIPDDMKQDFTQIQPFLVAEQRDVDVPGYQVDRPMIKVRPSHAQLEQMFQSGEASTANYYAFLLPPDNFEAYWNWVGVMGSVGGAVVGTAGQALSGEPIAGRPVFFDLQTAMDPMRTPAVGLGLKTISGQKVWTTVGDTTGMALGLMGAAEPVEKYKAQEGFSGAGAVGVRNQKWVITDPTISLLWGSVGAPISSLDTNLVQPGEEFWDRPRFRTLLKLGAGLPYAEILPAHTQRTETYNQNEGKNNIPVAPAPNNGAAYFSVPVSQPVTTPSK